MVNGMVIVGMPMNLFYLQFFMFMGGDRKIILALYG
jgi:hypothetical protein